MRSVPRLLIAAFLAACARPAPEAPVPTPSSTAPRAIAVYRAIAESIYVRSTGRIVAVATVSLDGGCSEMECAGLASRWGVDQLWWAHGDSAEARDARPDLLSPTPAAPHTRALPPRPPMLLVAHPG